MATESKNILDKRLILPLLVIIGMLIVAIGIYSYLKSGEEKKQALSEEESGIKIKAEFKALPERPSYCVDAVKNGEFDSEDSCFASLAVNNENYAYCAGIRDSSAKDSCFFDAGIKFNSIYSCAAIAKDSGEGSEDECAFMLATGTGDIEPCFIISGGDSNISSEKCIFEVAKQQRLESLCGFLGEDGSYSFDRCIAAISSGAQGAE